MSERSNNKPTANAARLKDVIASYGADHSNWPAADRNLFEAEGLAGAEVQQDLVAAREMDALLSQATAPAANTAAVTRITTYILEQPPGDVDQKVVSLAARQQRPASGPRQRLGSTWPAATLIAASLVLGVALGRSSIWDDVATGLFLGEDTAFAELSDAVLGLQFSPDTFSEDL